MYENHHKIKTYKEFIAHYMPIIYQEYVKQFTSKPLEDVYDLYPYIQIHFGYSKDRRASNYKTNKQVMKRKTIIGEVRKRKRVRKKKHIQEIRTDRKPTKREIRSGDKNKNQQVTTKVFNHIKTEETTEILESNKTLEILEIIEEPLDIVDEIVPVVDIEFVKKSILTEVDSMVDVESKKPDQSMIALKEELSSKAQFIEHLMEEKIKLQTSLDIVKKYEDIQSNKILHLLRAIEYYKLKVAIYQRACKCKVRIDEAKLHIMVNKIMAEQAEESQHSADSEI